MERPGIRERLRRNLVAGWAGKGLFARALLPLAWFHALLLWQRRLWYRAFRPAAERLPVPVIVVGNVVAGGSGKTPVVIALVEHLRSRGWTPGVIARGYGRSTQALRLVDAASDPTQVGDEPALIHRRTGAPVAVAQRRTTAAQALLRAHPTLDILVSDDGLQHLALARDVEIVVSGPDGVGNGWLLPAGPLREPWPRRHDFLLDAGALESAARFRIGRRLSESAHARDDPAVPLDALRTRTPPPWALAGIAHPERFFDMLRARGLRLAGTIALPDHAPITAADLRACAGATLLCTEKDAVKLWRLRPDALAVGLELDIDPAFWPALDRALPAPPGSAAMI